MRNVDNDRAAQESWPDDGAGVYTSAMARRSRRRKQVMGAVGLVILLGGGALVARQLGDDADTVTTGDTGALAPITEPSTSVPGVLAPSGRPSAAAASTGVRSFTVTPSPSTVAQRVAAARSAAAKAGTTPRAPLPPKAGGAYAQDVEVATKGSVAKDRRTLKVVSAREDLTGQRELAWVADGGEPVGSSRCTQTFRFSGGTTAAERPTLLVCWRTSAEKSVYTVAVDLDGRPSKQASVAEIDKTWAKLT
jgi:hypothetical protein